MKRALIVIAIFVALEVTLVYAAPVLAIAFVFNESPAWNVLEWEPAGRAALLFALSIFGPAIGIASGYLSTALMRSR